MSSKLNDEKFAIQHGVEVLLKQIFGLDDDGTKAQQFSEQLVNSVASPRSAEFQNIISNVLTQLKSRSSDPSALESYFEELKSTSPQYARSILLFLGQMAQNHNPLSSLASSVNDESWATAETVTPTTTQNPSLACGLSDVLEKLQLDSGFVTRRSNASMASPNIRPRSALDFGLDNLAASRLSSDFRSIAVMQTPAWRIQRNETMKRLFPNRQPSSYYGPFPPCDYLDPFDKNFEQLDLRTQENLIIDDLLRCFLGHYGTNIHADRTSEDDQIRFSINLAVDSTIREQAKRLLVLAVNFDTTKRFEIKYSGPTYGCVSQGLCTELRQFLTEYGQSIIMLETQKRQNGLNLQSLYYQLLPQMKLMAVFADIAKQIIESDLIGGGILTLLHRKQLGFIGNNDAREVCLKLLNKASVQYFFMLKLWLYTGKIHDPCMEFMVWKTAIAAEPESNGTTMEFDETDTWESRYTFINELCPDFLYRVKDEILKCGKYVNIVNACGYHVNLSTKARTDLIYSIDDKNYLKIIERACSDASEEMLKLLLQNHNLIARFRSMKRFFLVDQGDWLLQFMETAESELDKLVEDVFPDRLYSLMEVALRTSVVAHDKFKDDIQLSLTEHSLTSFLKAIIQIGNGETDALNRAQLLMGPEAELYGWQGLTLEYQPKWPLSIIFHRKSVVQYQFIFRRLLACKLVERLLTRTWQLANDVADDSDKVTRILRQSMLLFVQNYMYYCSVEVIDPNWTKFIAKVELAKNVEQVLECHGQFLDDCTKDLMLTDESLVDIMNRILQLCQSFAKNQIVSHKKCMRKFTHLIDELVEKIRSMGVTPQQQKGTSWLNFVERMQVNEIPRSTLAALT